jgi:hypothetical protein
MPVSTSPVCTASRSHLSLSSLAHLGTPKRVVCYDFKGGKMNTMCYFDTQHWGGPSWTHELLPFGDVPRAFNRCSWYLLVSDTKGCFSCRL